MGDKSFKKNLIGLAVVIAAAIVLFSYIEKKGGKLPEFLNGLARTSAEGSGIEGEKKGNAALGSISLEAANKSIFKTNGKGFFYCTKDGLRYYSETNNIAWNDTYTMISPVAVSENGYLAVTEIGGKSVRVYDKKGPLYTVQLENSLVQASLNSGGYLSAILKSKDGYIVQAYNAAGGLLTERIDPVTGIYPISADISDDGRTLAVSYMDTTDIEIMSRIVFLYINQAEGKNYVDSMYAAVEKPGKVVPVIKFMKGNSLAAISDKSVFLMDENGGELWEEELLNEIDKAVFAGNDHIAVGLGDEFVNEEGMEKGTILWFGLKGKTSASFAAGDEITYLYGDSAGVVVGTGNRYAGVNNSGKALWEYTADNALEDVLFLDDAYTVLSISKSTAEILDMRSR